MEPIDNSVINSREKDKKVKLIIIPATEKTSQRQFAAPPSPNAPRQPHLERPLEADVKRLASRRESGGNQAQVDVPQVSPHYRQEGLTPMHRTAIKHRNPVMKPATVTVSSLHTAVNPLEELHDGLQSRPVAFGERARHFCRESLRWQCPCGLHVPKMI